MVGKVGKVSTYTISAILRNTFDYNKLASTRRSSWTPPPFGGCFKGCLISNTLSTLGPGGGQLVFKTYTITIYDCKLRDILER